MQAPRTLDDRAVRLFIVLAAVFPGFSALYPTVKVLSGGLPCDWCRQADPPKVTAWS